MKIKMGVIGLGERGYSMICAVISRMEDVEIVSVCDEYADRCDRSASYIEKMGGKRPECYTDYKELLEKSDVDAVFIAAAWEAHAEIAIAAMKKGVATALEVGGAYSIESLWEMVRVQESTKTPFMFMENCCFGEIELFATSMAKAGKFGKIVHCKGAYTHDLREEISTGNIERHYRLRNYMKRNCDNYPTHGLGPIAKILGINRGNKMVSLVSVASCSKGLKEYIESEKLYEKDQSLKNAEFSQGDIVNTIITCAGGETILLTLDTTLPHYYNRDFTVRGTKGFYEQAANVAFFDGGEEYWSPTKFYRDHMDNAKEYYQEYLPPEWTDITEETRRLGHGGMDNLLVRRFMDCFLNGEEMPIDVYDAASWMVISALTEKSIAQGGAPQSIPDFTNGKWIIRAPKDVLKLPY